MKTKVESCLSECEPDPTESFLPQLSFSFIPALNAFLLAVSRQVLNAVQSGVSLATQAANPAVLRHHLLIKNWQASLRNKTV